MAVMNILICDDIHDEALKLEKAINESAQQEDLSFNADILCFEKGSDVLEYLKKNESGSLNIDVCFFDIIMPEMNGIELAANMRAAGFNGKIIFLTASGDYGVESYQVKAYFYLLKPVNTEDISKLLREIINDTQNEDVSLLEHHALLKKRTLLKRQAQIKQRAGIKIETRNMTRFVYFNQISFVEVINKNVYFRLMDRSEIVIFASLNDVLPQLMADRRFAQCHRSFVVNMDAIAQIQGKEILLRCGRKAPISRGFNDFNGQYFDRVFSEDKNG